MRGKQCVALDSANDTAERTASPIGDRLGTATRDPKAPPFPHPSYIHPLSTRLESHAYKPLL